jgi:hypothetical protein
MKIKERIMAKFVMVTTKSGKEIVWPVAVNVSVSSKFLIIDDDDPGGDGVHVITKIPLDNVEQWTETDTIPMKSRIRATP